MHHNVYHDYKERETKTENTQTHRRETNLCVALGVSWFVSKQTGSAINLMQCV